VGWVLGVLLVGTPASCVYVVRRLLNCNSLALVRPAPPRLPLRLPLPPLPLRLRPVLLLPPRSPLLPLLLDRRG
jgi:hypothetical protein